jgi:hypothetical protein
MTTSPRTPHTPFRLRPAHLALAAVLALPVVACGVADARADVDGSVRCTMTSAGDVQATGTVTNHSSKASSYWVDITISVDGDEVDTRTAVAEDVEPGDSVPLEAILRDAPAGDPTCEITDVLRVKA